MYPIADCLAPNTEAVRISITTPMMYVHALGLTVNWFSPKTLIGKLGVWGMIEGELPGQEGLVGVIATGPITDLPVDNKGKKNTRYVPSVLLICAKEAEALPIDPENVEL